MTVWYKQGVCGDLQIPMQKALTQLDNLRESDIYITSIRDGNHQAGSLHYIGLAIDIRPTVGVDSIRAALGINYDVVPETNHIHIEYDPK